MIIDRKSKPFSPQELRVIGTKPSGFPGHPASDIFNAPISYRENALSLFLDKRPCFAVTSNDFSGVNSAVYKKYMGRSARDGDKIDAFGVKWIFEPTAGGSITVPGNPRFTDANDWKDVLTMPDIHTWDWAGDAAANPADPRFAVEMTMVNLLHVFQNALQAMGNSTWSMYSGIAEFAGRVFMAKVAINFIGSDALFISEPVAWLGATLLVMLPYFHYRKTLLAGDEI